MEYAEVVERALDEGSDDRDDLRGLEGQEGAGDSDSNSKRRFREFFSVLWTRFWLIEL